MRGHDLQTHRQMWCDGNCKQHEEWRTPIILLLPSKGEEKFSGAKVNKKFLQIYFHLRIVQTQCVTSHFRLTRTRIMLVMMREFRHSQMSKSEILSHQILPQQKRNISLFLILTCHDNLGAGSKKQLEKKWNWKLSPPQQLIIRSPITSGLLGQTPREEMMKKLIWWGPLDVSASWMLFVKFFTLWPGPQMSLPISTLDKRSWI